MQPLNDDMDDLFRHASEEYPLNTKGADWNNVLHKLQHTEDLSEENQQKKDYKFLWLLLLLPLGFVCGRYIHDSSNLNSSKNRKEIKLNVTASHKTNSIKPQLENKDIKSLTPRKSSSVDHEASNTKKDQAQVSQQPGNVTIVINAPVTIISNPTLKNKVKYQNSKHHFPRGIKVSKAPSPFTKQGIDGAINSPLNNITAKTSLFKNKPATAEDKTFIIEEHNLVKAKPVTNIVDSNNTIVTKAEQVNLQSAIADSSVNNKKLSKKRQKNFKPYFYYSLVAGPDVSVIKFQKTSNAGYSLGVMLGYQVTKQLSIITGALFDKKLYYTNGKYLDTSRLKLPGHSIVLNADGYCKMIEIPVNIKYDFNIHAHSWFLSTGLSSYLMQQEDYNLEYTRYNTPYRKEYGYSHSSKDWFSILNISGGYQKSLGKQTNISISPYFKIPLKGIGIGKLPLSSTGIYLSVSRKIN